MEIYTLAREFADSWALLALVLVFLGVVIWAFRPGSRGVHQNAAGIPFRHDDRPAADSGPSQEALK
ncbi:MAG: cbb3-type cytochrome c oxidase subunit 3 [Defluviimonas sp.]|uniref:cbb3-type cytochrome c oxidase subunit 3 n=1 Tax=Albidovulum sp. TaxID=1872424 RepID=UPI001D740538|nr:cbb3-type cytochrome c oxidase subunit 3 [Paracoccaceae bacterium]MCC0062574.1 cbb3-type cytochrome c oxidase subunit 3 [Defluviimonas sp.]